MLNAAAFTTQCRDIQKTREKILKSEPSMPQHSLPNAAAFDQIWKIGLKSETSMPQHSVTNAAAFKARLRKIKRPKSPILLHSFFFFSQNIKTSQPNSPNPKSLNTQLLNLPKSSFQTLNPTSKHLISCNPSTTKWFQRVLLLGRKSPTSLLVWNLFKPSKSPSFWKLEEIIALKLWDLNE